MWSLQGCELLQASCRWQHNLQADLSTYQKGSLRTPPTLSEVAEMVSRSQRRDGLLSHFHALDMELGAVYTVSFHLSSDSGWWFLLSFIYWWESWGYTEIMKVWKGDPDKIMNNLKSKSWKIARKWAMRKLFFLILNKVEKHIISTVS